MTPATTLPARVIAADPPWPFGDKLPGEGRGAAKNYSLLSIADLCAFPLPPIADDAVLFLWRVASMQQEALDVMKAWGFVQKTELVWEKLRHCAACKGGGKSLKRAEAGLVCGRCNGLGALPWFGMGRIVRGTHETCLIGTRGRPERLCASIRSSFQALMPSDEHGRALHSAKPDHFFQLVQRLYAGPYVELFARRRRDGWTGYGDELPARAASVELVNDGGAHVLG